MSKPEQVTDGAGGARRLLRVTGALAGLPKPYLTSLYDSWRRREDFSALRAYCMFVGYPRSGHSLVGSLLDAHPDVVIAHELDALKYVRARFRREQLFHLLLDKSEEFTARGRQWNGYSYEVPGQWQGRRRSLRVIGDKKGGGSTMRLGADPRLLARLRRTVGVPVKLVHVVRNPFDNIST
ncbi:MAG: sulfotransferase, partial [Acidobacteria bacterium]|nr:sulfotransferase [Acidobacteriota bacterium]